MESQSEAIQAVVSALDVCGIPYMIVGSFAASMYGISRSTHDMDIVVALQSDDVEKLADALGEKFYMDEVSAQEAILKADMFNILHYDSNLKVDFFILRNDALSRTQFERRVTVKAWGIEACIESPEDTILSKLLWNKITPSERQLDDARGMIKEMREALDYGYLHHWASEAGIEVVLDQLLEESNE